MMPDPHYMDTMQPELQWHMRGILVDFLIRVHERFKGNQESLFLACNIMDRFMSKRPVDLTRYQLVGSAALFVALKVEEQFAPSGQQMAYVCGAAFTEEELFTAERYILKAIDWNLSYPNPLNFLRRISKADGYDVDRRTLGKYLIEIGTLEPKLVATLPSLL